MDEGTIHLAIVDVNSHTISYPQVPDLLNSGGLADEADTSRNTELAEPKQ